MAAFHLIIYGRFWVITEVQRMHLRRRCGLANDPGPALTVLIEGGFGTTGVHLGFGGDDVWLANVNGARVLLNQP
jgi:hypothetical protein